MNGRDSENYSLGTFHFNRLLEATDAKISGTLVADGKQRKYKMVYEFEENDDYILITYPATGKEVKIPKSLNLTPQIVAFLGMYYGDGTKASESGKNGRLTHRVNYSGKTPELISFVAANFRKIFGEDITFTFEVGEDSAYFLAPKRKNDLDSFREAKLSEEVDSQELESSKNIKKINIGTLEKGDRRWFNDKKGRKFSNQELIEILRDYHQYKPLMELYLYEEKRENLSGEGILSPQDRIRTNVRRPFVKGSRQFGQSSRSDETTIYGCDNFAAILLKFVYILMESIINRQKDFSINGISILEWKYEPWKNDDFKVDIAKYVNNSKNCKWITNSGEERRYIVYSTSKANTIVLKKKDGKAFLVRNPVELSPAFCFFSGLYFAEGRTSDKTYLHYSNHPGEYKKVGLGLPSSEKRVLSLILKILDWFFPNFRKILKGWKLKIGSAYMFETSNVGEKMGIPLLRDGTKGQGKSPALAVADSLRNWIFEEFPVLKNWDSHYSHIEFTGAGIPRPHFWCSGSPAILIISLIHDLIFEPDERFYQYTREE